jgi:8-oxo-dGTP diphosphatase
MGDEVRPSVAVGAVVFRQDGHVLLVKRARPPSVGAWTLPGGKVEAAESLAAAIVREVREETGLVVRVRASLGAVELAREGFRFTIHEWLCEPLGATEATAADDAADARWVRVSDLETLGVSSEVSQLVRRAELLVQADQGQRC